MPDLTRLFSPASVAVIGAAPDEHILRGRIMRVLGCHEYAGPIYPISRSHAEIMGLKAFPTIADAPGPVDLAVIIIPAKHIPAALEDCAAAGVKAATIIASGFAEEPSDQGAGLQDRIRAIAERTGILILGPNSEGFATMAQKLCPTFSPAVDGEGIELTPPGSRAARIAVIAQSGGMGFAFYDRGRPMGLRFSHVITTGNEACIESLDVVEYLIDHDEADVFLIFMEDVKTPAKLPRIARKALAAGKPMIVAKIGRSEAGARAAASHTASLAGDYQGYRAVFQRYGIIEGRDTEEMVGIAAAFSLMGDRLPAGRRVAIFTGSGGAGGWLADACEGAGLTVPMLDAETRARIDPYLPAYGTSQNPVDGTAGAIRELGYARVCDMLTASGAVDALICIASARSPDTLGREEEALKAAIAAAAKPILMWSYTHPHEVSARIVSEAGLPLYSNMQNAARALAALAEWRENRDRYTAGSIPETASKKPPAALAKALAASPESIAEVETMRLLELAGIDGAAGTLTQTAAEAVAAADSFAGPVALKIQSADIPHKSAAGGVALNVSGAAAVETAWHKINAAVQAAAPGATILGTLVQPMARPGLEMILGIDNRAGFGPVLMVGFGGVAVEASRDVVFGLAPFTLAEASALLTRLRGAALLDTARYDLAALASLMVQLADFALLAADTVAEIDLNPVLVHGPGEGVTIVDALMFKQTPPPLNR